MLKCHIAGPLITLCLGLTALSSGPAKALESASSVGRLLIPGLRHEGGYPRHINEHCSATLVGSRAHATSRWIVTAWHCLEFYRDLSRPIEFLNGGERVRARRVVSGGDMSADWALLKLERPLPGPAVLAEQGISLRMPLLMAGYSREKDRATPPPLSWDSQCIVTGREGPDVRSNCQARRGSSGGAVFTRGAQSPAFLGVISRGDSDALSIFVPLQRFRARITPYLRSG